jgi:hypothetical protein
MALEEARAAVLGEYGFLNFRDVIITRVTFREVSYMALDKTFAGHPAAVAVPSRLLTERKKKGRRAHKSASLRDA